jgi:hypothetical protein
MSRRAPRALNMGRQSALQGGGGRQGGGSRGMSGQGAGGAAAVQEEQEAVLEPTRGTCRSRQARRRSARTRRGGR